MKAILKIIVIVFVFTVGTFSAVASPGEPLASLGNIKYNYTGPSEEPLTQKIKDSVASFYNASFEGYLINGGASMGVTGDALKSINQMRKEDNELNSGMGGLFTGVDKNGKPFEYYQKYIGDLPEAQYRIDTTINVWKLPGTDDKFDMNFHVNIVDRNTGEVVGSTSTWRRNTEKYVNYKTLGPKPTWYEKYISGYVREITFDDPLTSAMNEASKTIINKLAILKNQKISSDVDRFLDNVAEQRAQVQQSEQPQNKTDDTVKTIQNGQTAWGSADNWETAYEGYFWMHIQSPSQYPTFDVAYSLYDPNNKGSNDAIGAMLHTLPLGEPVDLREYFNTPGVRERYETLRSTRKDSNMPPLLDFLNNIDQYQTNLKLTTPAEPPAVSSEPQPEISNSPQDPMNSPDAIKFQRWTDCMKAQPPTKTRADLDRPDPCKAILDLPATSSNFSCKKAADGSCLPDVVTTVPR